MEISLREYSKQQGYSHVTGWRKAKKGEFETVKRNGSIYVKVPDLSPPQTQSLESTTPDYKEVRANNQREMTRLNDFYQKKSDASDIGVRNKNNTSPSSERFYNLKGMYQPTYNNNASIYKNSCITIREILELCKIAYWNFADVRNAINTQAEFSASPIYLTGGNKKSQEFYKAWFKAISLPEFTYQFFLEWNKLSNVFIFPFIGKVKQDYIVRIQEAVGCSESLAAKLDLPLKYMILNPTSVMYNDSLFITNSNYYQILSAEDVKSLKNPSNDIDKQIFNSLPETTRKQIQDSNVAQIQINLEAQNVIFVFNSKMDYDPFAVPLVWAILDDLDAKLSLKRMDKNIAEICQQIVLHVKMGYENKNGEYIFPFASAEAIQDVLKTDSIFKLLITDFTGEMDYKIPAVSELLGSEKYKILNEDIRSGLMNILFGGGDEKFANLHIKVKVFVERLKKAREVFLNKFLIPEMEKIGKQVGFKNIPTPHFEEVQLEDPVNFHRVITRLAELGILTPSEVIKAVETYQLPTDEENKESQLAYKADRDKGLYEPLIGGGKDPQGDGSGGRPSGSKGPQTTKKVSPIGTKRASEGYDFNTLIDLSKQEVDLKIAIAEKTKKIHKLDKLTLEQQKLVSELGDQIMLNEDADKWNDKITSYIKGDFKENKEAAKQIKTYMDTHKCSYDLAKLLYLSQE